MFLLLLFLSLFNHSFYGLEVITPSQIWTDDFKLDRSKYNGWWIFNKNDVDPQYYDPENLKYTGSNKQYHGPFTKINDKNNYLIRKFQCTVPGPVYVSYSFAFCRTEGSDNMIAMKPNLSCGSSSCFAQNDGLSRNGVSYFTDSTVIFAASGISNKYDDNCGCQWCYRYKTRTNINIGTVQGGDTFEVALRASISGDDEFIWIYDIKVDCGGSPTISPTYTSTTLRPTNSPSMAPTPAPSVSPTEAPSIAFGNPTPAPLTSPHTISVRKTG
eukprot:26216_1